MSSAAEKVRGPGDESLPARARRMVERSDFRGAERLLVAGLDDPKLPPSELAEARYVLAVAQRYQGRPGDGLETIDRLLRDEPGYGRAWQERGHALLALKKNAEARESFEQALRFNPALPGSWQMLVRAYGDAGMEKHQRAARDQLERLQNLPRELISVTSMIHEGKLYRAERLCRHFLQGNRHHVEAMRLLAIIGNELDVLTDAEFLLESCLELEPDYDQARYDFANVLLKMQKFEAAHRQCQILLDRHPGNLAFRALLANAASGIGDHHNAISLYDEVLEKSPRQNELWVMRGHALKTVGDREGAIDSYHRACELKPDYGDAWWSLANLKRYRFSDEEIARMERAEAGEGVATEDRIHLCFALGKAYEDREEHRRAFGFYERGNRLKRDTVKHKASHLNIRTRAQIEVCSEELFERRSGAGHEAPDPIFIVGLPRAGSTLLEQILASHSKVKGTYELPHIIALAQRLRGSERLVEGPGAAPRYPQVLAELDEDYFRRFGEQYIEDTRLYRHGAEYFIDKNPNNFFHVGLIRLILPNAKVIDARRHPL
ncbi:MAG: sulfotransferase, partial [Gammaproteobacteria bacterium]